MSATIGVACGVLGLLVGALLPIVIERVPPRAPLLRAPFPEVGSSLRTAGGKLLIIGTGALFAAIGVRFHDTWVLPSFLLLAGALVALSVIDLRLFVLPNRIIYPVTGASIVLLGIAALAEGDGSAYWRALACAAGALVVFLVLHVVAPGGMGFGDVRLAFLLGLDLGWLGVGEVVLGLFLGFVYGAVIGLVLIAIGRRSRDQHIPFGPFLAAGTMTAIYFESEILDWYPV